MNGKFEEFNDLIVSLAGVEGAGTTKDDQRSFVAAHGLINFKFETAKYPTLKAWKGHVKTQ